MSSYRRSGIFSEKAGVFLPSELVNNHSLSLPHNTHNHTTNKKKSSKKKHQAKTKVDGKTKGKKAKMKLMNLPALFGAITLSAVVNRVDGAGFELNGGSCEEADRKSEVGYFRSSLEQFYGPVDPNSLTVIPAGTPCEPFSSNVFGAWYKLQIDGSSGLTLDTTAFLTNGAPVNQSIAVMEGSCESLTCVGYAKGQPNSVGQQEAYATFTMKANTRYFVFYSVGNEVGAAVPSIGIQAATPEAQCNLYRSDQIIYDSYSGGGLGTCTPCTSSVDANGATNWRTNCTDACQHCYNISGAPFCYTESRIWNYFGANQNLDIDYCYNFPDGTNVCDQGSKDGACPGLGLSVNGVTCTDCVQQFGVTPCASDSSIAYGNFKATCATGVGDATATIDKCTNTGFDQSPALFNYALYTDVILANQYGLGAYVPPYQGTCDIYEDEGLPIATPAPTATPVVDPPIVSRMDRRSESFDIVRGQNKLFTIDVTGTVGIVQCEVDGDDGDIDLYVGIDVVPIGSNFAGCASELFGSKDECSVLIDGDKRELNVIAYGYRDATDATMKCELTGLNNAREFDVDVDEWSSTFDLKEGQYRLYKMDVPQSTQRASCETQVEDGDLDLFFRIGGLPMPYVSGKTDCTSNTFTGNEYCELTDGISGNDLYILVQGYGNVTDGKFTCTVTLDVCGNCLYEDDARELKLDEGYGGWSLLENENRLFYTNVPEGSRKIWCNLDTDDGDVDLYMRVDGAPVLPGDTFEGGVFDCGSLSPTGNEYCFYEWDEETGAPQKVSVYSLVTGYAATKDIHIKCEGDIPLTKDDADRIRDGRAYGTNLEKDEEKLVVFEVDEAIDYLVCQTEARRGDVDIFSKENEVPQRYGGDNQRNSEESGSDERIEWEFNGGPGDGAYGDEDIYILLAGFEDTRDVELLCVQFIDVIVDFRTGATERQPKGPPRMRELL